MSDFLNYRGDRTNYDPEQLYGPDRFGAYYRAVSASYDPATDRTRLEMVPAFGVAR